MLVLRLNPEIVSHLQHIQIGPLEFHGYGFILGIAFSVALLAFLAYAPKKITRDKDFPILLISTVAGAIIGGRLLFVLNNLSDQKSLLDVFSLWTGGITIFGVIIGGILGYALFWYIFKFKRKKMRDYPFFTFPDSAVPAVVLGQAIGRWGNFINQELYGYPTEGSISMYIQPQNRLPGYESFETFHPAFLYESILSVILFIFLFTLYKLLPKSLVGTGILTGLYLMLYGGIRLVTEQFRIDSQPVFIGLKPAELATLVLIMIGIIITSYGIIKSHGTSKKEK